MKTVIDAVNEFKGVAKHHDQHNPNWFNFVGYQLKGGFYLLEKKSKFVVCTREEFNQCVVEMSKAEWIKPKEPIYTQEMSDDGVLPGVGMECLIKLHHHDNSHFQKGYINGYSQDKKWIILTDYLGNIESHNISNGTYEFKPLTPPIELIDGKAYQFTCNSGGIVIGIYSTTLISFDNYGRKFYQRHISNIKPLTVEVKS